MVWIGLGAFYCVPLILMLFLWNRRLGGLLQLLLLISNAAFIGAAFFGAPWPCSVGFVFGNLLSVAGW